MFGRRRSRSRETPPPSARQSVRPGSVELPEQTLRDAQIPRVDFLIVGAMKCGTTTLRRVLSAHPQVHMPAREIHFFGNHRRYLSVWDGGRLDAQALEDAYGQHYRTDRPVRGAKTPNYVISSLTIERIQRFHPRARLVLMVRDPVTRAQSHWNHLLRQVESGRMPAERVGATFAEHVARDREELDGARVPDAEIRGTNILYRGMYSVQLRRLWRFFPRDRVRVCVLADLKADPEAFFTRLLAFLELAPAPDAVANAADASEARAPRHTVRLGEEDLAGLRAFYAESVADLVSLLGRPLPGWLS